LDSVSHATDCSTANGKIYLTATGGVMPYEFKLNGLDLQPGNVFLNLRSGIYTGAVRDKRGCEAYVNNIPVLAGGFHFTATVQNDSECLTHNGSVQIEVLEGAAPYQYKMDDGAFAENNLFSGLAAGQYVFTVHDANACNVLLDITIPRAHTATSWINDILPIMQASCALSGCHDGKSRIDYRIHSNAMKNSADIKFNTQNRSMPFDGPALSKNQIDLIACWVDDGALNN
jgi:hypothetical protein